MADNGCVAGAVLCAVLCAEIVSHKFGMTSPPRGVVCCRYSTANIQSKMGDDF